MSMSLLFVIERADAQFTSGCDVIVSVESTIQDEIDTLPENSKICVDAGTYNEELTIDKAGITLIPYHSDYHPVFSGTGTGTGITIQADNVTIDRFSFEDFEIDILLSDASDAAIQNNTFDAGIVFNDYESINSVDLSAFAHNITDNTFHDGSELFYANGVHNPVIPANAGQIVVISSTGRLGIQDFEIEGRAVPIQIVATENIAIEDNTISGIGNLPGTSLGLITVSESDDVQINGNSINNGNDGIYIFTSDEVRVFNNTITNSTNDGLSLDSNTNITVDENEIKDNRNGIDIYSNTNLEVSYNKIHSNWQDGIIVASNTNSFRYNSFEQNGFGFRNNGFETQDARLNWWGDGAGPGGSSSDPVTFASQDGDMDGTTSNVRFDPWLTSPLFNFSVSSTNIYTGDVVLVNSVMEYNGEGTEEFDLELKVDGQTKKVKTVSIDSTASLTVEIDYQFDNPGTYEIQIGELAPQEITVKEGWTQYNFSANRNTVSEMFSGPDTTVVEEKWLFEVDGYVLSSPAVVNGAAYFGANNNFVYAVDIDTGEEIWSFETGGNVRSSPTVKGDTLFIGSRDGNLYGLDINNGQKVMEIDAGGEIWSSPLVVGEVLYVSVMDEANGQIFAHHLGVNDRMWSYTTDASISSSPSYADGVVYVGSNDNHIYAFRANSGEKLWSVDTGYSVSNAPTVVNGVLYVGNSGILSSENYTFYALDAEDGSELWSEQLDESIANSATVAGDTVFVSTREKLFALDSLTGSEIWSFELPVEFGSATFGGSSPVITSDFLYIGSTGDITQNRRVHGLNRNTGEQVWEFTTGMVHSTPVVMDDILYVNGSDRGLWAIQNQEPYDVYVDNEFSELSALTPQWANGRDSSKVSFTLHDQKDNPISGLTEIDLIIELPASVSYENFKEISFREGDYQFTMTTETPGTVVPSIRLDSIEVEHSEEVEFRDTTSSWRVEIEAVWQEFEEIDFLHFEAMHLGSVEFTGNDTGWAIGEQGTIIYTRNAGKEWAVQNSGTEETLTGLSFVNSKTGWIAGSNGTILSTKDGGDTWEPLKSGTEDFLSSIWFINEKEGWAAGVEGLILKTEDGGETWSQHSTGYGNDIFDLQFTSAETGWAVSGFDGLIKTVDSGETWTKVVENSQLQSVQFLDENTGWAAGGEHILHTSDGGENWSAVYEGLHPVSITEVSFADQTHGIAVGSGDGIIRTDDGGKSWKLEYAGEAYLWIADVVYTDPEIAWAVSPLGTVLHYNDGSEEILPVVNASNSTVSATSPHIADGEDTATVTVDVRDTDNEPVDHFSADDITIVLTGDAEVISEEKTEKESVFLFEVINSTPETVTVEVLVDGTELDETPEILFEKGTLAIRPYDLTITETEEGLELEWQADSESQISSFIVYKGEFVSGLLPADTLDTGKNIYSDEVPGTGTNFYAVSAVNTENEEGPLSDKISYLNSSLTSTDTWKLASVALGSGEVEAENTTAFHFDEQYQSVSALEPSRGYWIKSKSYDEEEMVTKGQGLDHFSITLREGWNLVGSLSDTISVTSVADSSGILTDAPVYSYTDGGYQPVDSLAPQQGYWIFASDSGRIDFSVDLEAIVPEADQQKKPGDGETREEQYITFTSGGISKKLWVSDSAIPQEERYRHYLPPLAPDPVLDIRTTGPENIADQLPARLEVTASGYPVTVEMSETDEVSDFAYRLTVRNGSSERFIDLLPGQTHMIREEPEEWELTKVHMSDIISEPKLLPNYPNPFNPVTTIEYQVQGSAHIKIEVYDVIGRLTQVLMDDVQLSGRYRVEFDGSRLASGMYLVRFHADHYVDVRKIMLIK